MATFNREKAKADGFTDAQIDLYLKTKVTPTPSPQVPQQPQQEQQGRFLGGNLPAVLGTGGALVGGAAAGPFGAIPLAGAGAGIGEGATQILGSEPLDVEKIRNAAGLSSLAEGVMGPVGAVGKKLLGPLAKIFGDKLPKMFARSALKETGRAGEKAFEKSALGTGKEVGEEVVDRGIVGSAKGLVKYGTEQLKSFEDKIQSSLSKIPVYSLGTDLVEQGKLLTNDVIGKARMGAKGSITNVEKFLIDSLDEAGKTVAQVGGVTKMSQLPKIQAEIADIFALQSKKIAKDGWKALLELRRNADKLGKGEATTDISSITKKVNAELANVLRKRFGEDPEILKYAPEMASNIKEKQFFIRLLDTAVGSGKQAPLSKSEMLTMLMGSGLIGGGVGVGTGNPLLGLLSGAGTAGVFSIPKSPLLSTGVAQGLKKGTKVAGEGMKQGTRTLLQMLAPYITNSMMKKE